MSLARAHAICNGLREAVGRCAHVVGARFERFERKFAVSVRNAFRRERRRPRAVAPFGGDQRAFDTPSVPIDHATRDTLASRGRFELGEADCDGTAEPRRTIARRSPRSEPRVARFERRAEAALDREVTVGARHDRCAVAVQAAHLGPGDGSAARVRYLSLSEPERAQR